MPAEVFAVMAAIGIAAGDVIGRVAVRSSSAYTGGILTSAVGLVLFGAPWLFLPSPVAVNIPGTLWFFLAGMVHPGFGIVIIFQAFRRIGVARTAAFLGTSPFFTLIVSMLFLGERPGWIVAAGTLFVVCGVVIISLEEGASGSIRRKDLGYPFLGAFLFGLVPVLRKAGMNHIPSPIFGMAASSLAGVVALVAVVKLFPPGERFIVWKKELALFSAAGVLLALGVYLYFVALNKGTVSVLAPLLFTYPLFVLIISYLSIRKLERLTIRLATGALLVVAGAAIITGLR